MENVWYYSAMNSNTSTAKPALQYRYRYYTNVGRLVQGECSTVDELREAFRRPCVGGTGNKNFRQFSSDQGRTWSDY